MSVNLIQCEVCGAFCHGLADGSPRCLLHLPVPSGKTPPPGSAALIVEPEEGDGASGED